MSKNNKKEEVKQKAVDEAYTIKRVDSGYSIFDSKGNKLSEPDMFPITAKKLETLIRKSLGI